MDHTGHEVYYYEEQTVCRRIVDVLPNGNIEIHYKEFVEETNDIYLVCHDCGERIDGRDIGASDDWEAELLGC